MSEREIRKGLESIGVGVSRYGLVVVLTLIGLLKFTSPEAAGIQPWLRIVLSCLGCMSYSAFRASPT